MTKGRDVDRDGRQDTPEPYRTMIAERDAALAQSVEALRARNGDLERVHLELQRSAALVGSLPQRIRRSQIIAAITASIVTAVVLIGAQLIIRGY